MHNFNSLAPGRFEGNFIEVNFKLVLMIDGSGIFAETDFRLILFDLTNEKSTLVQVMAWCRQATSHYLTQCLPRSMSPNGVTRPQWVKLTCQLKQMSWTKYFEWIEFKTNFGWICCIVAIHSTYLLYKQFLQVVNEVLVLWVLFGIIRCEEGLKKHNHWTLPS